MKEELQAATVRWALVSFKRVGSIENHRIEVVNDVLDVRGRTALFRSSSLTLRSMEYWRKILPDYETMAVLLAIIAIGVSNIAKDEDKSDLRDLDRPLSNDELQKCNAASIAAATNLNRETVRRKVLKLIEMGLVSRESRDNIRVAPSVAQRSLARQLARAQTAAICSTVNALLKDGILRTSS